jgi:hypothetical protein
MKQLPTGNVMLGGELQEKIEFGLITRTLISILMKFTAKLLPSMRYSLGEAYKPEGKYECPHIASPLFRTMDRVFVTPEGEEPPELGKELPEPDSERNLRRGGKAPYADMKFEMGKTYSFSFHSMYLDFGNWVITNVPGYSGLNMKTLVETQSVSVVCYDVPFDPPGKTLKLFQCNKKYLTFMEYSHISVIPENELNEYNAFLENPTPSKTEGGAGAQRADAVEAGNQSPNRSVYAVENDAADKDGDGDSGGDDDNDDDALTDVPSNSFLPITLLHEDPPQKQHAGQPAAAVWPGVAGKNGFAVVREFQEVQNLKFIKLAPPAAAAVRKPRTRTALRMWPSKLTLKGKSKGDKNINMENIGSPESKDGDKDSDATDAFWNGEQKAGGEKLRNGDIIMVQSATTGEYLTIQRGWWLVWTARSPQSRKGHFIVTLVDREERVREDPSPLYVGFPFRLRSARWPTWQVGLQMAPSSSYGGKLLTLYHPPKSSAHGGDRHSSMDMSRPFAKNVTSDARLPAYSSKAVHPMVLSVLPESVCEKYSRETVGMVRSIMSLDAVFRSPNLSSTALTVSGLEAWRGEEAPLPGAPIDVGSPYLSSSRISMPLSTAGYHNLPLEPSGRVGSPDSAALARGISNRAKQPYSALSYRYFPRSVMDTLDLTGVFFELSGWVEVMNRETNTMQLAYLLACEVPDLEAEHTQSFDAQQKTFQNPRVIFSPSMLSTSSSGGYARARRFTLLRTGAQLLETLTAILAAQNPPEHAMKPNVDLGLSPLDYLSKIGRPDLKKAISVNSTDFSSVQGEPDLDQEGGSPGPDSPARRRGSSGARSDSSEDGEPDWAGGSFADSVGRRGGDDANTCLGSPIEIICPRYQSDADHSFQLLAAFLQMVQKKEMLLSSKDNDAVSSSESGLGSSPKKQQFAFPARRMLLRLAASSSDALTASFVGEVMKAGGVAAAGEGKAHPTPEKKKGGLMGRGSISSADLAGHSKVSPLLRTVVVARALWDCHWREEFVQLHSTFVSFFPLVSADPLLSPAGKSTRRKRRESPAKSAATARGMAPSGPACLTVLLVDITHISLMDEAFSKFPGYHILMLESLGRVTYIAFNSLNQAESFAGYVLELKSEAVIVEGSEGDISAVEGTALGDPRDSFVLRSGRWRPQSRMVLNSRRFQFDIEQMRTESILLNNSIRDTPWLISYPTKDAKDAKDAESVKDTEAEDQGLFGAARKKADSNASASFGASREKANSNATSASSNASSSPREVPYWGLSARLLRGVAQLSAPSALRGESDGDEAGSDGER